MEKKKDFIGHRIIGFISLAFILMYVIYFILVLFKVVRFDSLNTTLSNIGENSDGSGIAIGVGVLIAGIMVLLYLLFLVVIPIILLITFITYNPFILVTIRRSKIRRSFVYIMLLLIVINLPSSVMFEDLIIIIVNASIILSLIIFLYFSKKYIKNWEKELLENKEN